MRTLFIMAFMVLASVGAPTLVGAQNTQTVTNTSDTQTVVNTGSSVTLVNPLGSSNCSGNGNCLETFLLSILDFVIRVGTVVVILMLVFVGYKFVVAQGNDSKITEARTMLLWTVVGALVLLGSKVIADGITATVRALSG